MQNIDNASEDLVITISISGQVTNKDVANVHSENPDQLHIGIENPHVKRLLYRDQVKEIQKLFKDRTEERLRSKSYKKIHLLYSGPAGLAVELGRSINPRMWPEVLLYQFNNREAQRYIYVLTV